MLAGFVICLLCKVDYHAAYSVKRNVDKCAGRRLTVFRQGSASGVEHKNALLFLVVSLMSVPEQRNIRLFLGSEPDELIS